MNRKTVIGTVGASLAAGAVFAGTVVAGVSAQAPPLTPTSPSSPPTAQATPAGPKSGLPFPEGKHGPGKGGFDYGFGDFGERGPGKFAATADGANRQITGATDFLTLVKGDLTYATGKMDTANIQKWLTSADGLLKSAQSAVSSSKFERAGQYAQAAAELASTADAQMGITLGYDKLPSASQRPQGRMKGKMGVPNTSTVTITQAQASRILVQTYNQITAQKSMIKAGDATTYLTDAQNTYRTAYAAYGAGKYNEALTSAKLANQLLDVARHVQAASDAPDSPDTALPVPAPNF